MESYKMRRVLCYLLSLLMVIGGTLFIGTQVFKWTVCNEKFMSPFFNLASINEYCDNLYNERIEVLSNESGIPLVAFDAVDKVKGYSETAIDRFFQGDDTTLYTNDLVESFYKIFIEYLDGNEIKYDKTEIKNTAVKASEIYSDCYGLDNTTAFKAFVDTVNSRFAKLSSAGLLCIVASLILIYFVYSDKKKAGSYIAGSFSAIGCTCVLAGLLSIIFGVGRHIGITPEIYSTAVSKAFIAMFAILVLLGIAITAVTVRWSYVLNKLDKKHRNK